MADMTREQAVEVLLEMRSAMLSCYASADDAQLGRDALDVAITALTAQVAAKDEEIARLTAEAKTLCERSVKDREDANATPQTEG